MQLISCDTFVCLPPGTANNCIIFGKNSDRPEGEVQEIIHQPRKVHEKGSKLKTTYIEIDQCEETYAVILSKPSWMWGAEMGSNQFGVCIGNEAVWTKLMNSKEDLEKKLLGMDLVRLGLERSKSAREAVEIITSLLEKHGQGGPCSDSIRNWSYHNSYLIADKKEAWVLETAASLWAAERIESGYRNISNELSIGTKMDLKSTSLEAEAFKLGLWDGTEPLHFAKIFSQDYDPQGDGRFSEGRRLLKKYSENGQFDLKSMMNILRDKPSGICMSCDDSFPSCSSQVSVLNTKKDSTSLDCHWFTGTPDPMHSVFKPFFFTEGFLNDTMFLSEWIRSPATDKEFKLHKGKTDWRHELFKCQQLCYRKLVTRPQLKEKLLQLEDSFVEEVNGNRDLNEIFNNSVMKELVFYRGETRCKEP